MKCPYCEQSLTVKAEFIDGKFWGLDEVVQIEVDCGTDNGGKDCFPETWTYLKLVIHDSNWALMPLEKIDYPNG